MIALALRHNISTLVVKFGFVLQATPRRRQRGWASAARTC